MCHRRHKSCRNGLFCAQNKPFTVWMKAAKYTAFAAVDGGGGDAVSRRLIRRKGTNNN